MGVIFPQKQNPKPILIFQELLQSTMKKNIICKKVAIVTQGEAYIHD